MRGNKDRHCQVDARDVMYPAFVSLTPFQQLFSKMSKYKSKSHQDSYPEHAHFKSTCYLESVDTGHRTSVLMQAEESTSADLNRSSKPSTAGRSSRFTYDMLAEDEAVKPQGASRGKDGHVSLGNNDFFSNPLGASSSTRM